MKFVLFKYNGRFDAGLRGTGMPSAFAYDWKRPSFLGIAALFVFVLLLPMLALGAIAALFHGVHIGHLALATAPVAATVDLKKIADEAKTIFEQFKAKNEELETERKKFGEERAETKAALDKLQKALDEQEKKVQHLRLNGAGAETETKAAKDRFETKRFNAWIRGGEEKLNDEERKALSTDSDQDGGYVNFPNLSARILRKLILVSPIRQLATVETIGKGNSLSVPAEGVNNFLAARVGQRAARNNTQTGQLRFEEIAVHEYYAQPALTQQQIDDSAVDVESWAGDRVGTAFAQTTGQDYIAGTGVAMPEGILQNPNVGQVVTGSAALLTMDGMFDLMAALPTFYATMASIICNRKTTYALRKLKDSQNRYLWEPSPIAGNPASFDGKPVVEMPDMPDVGANAFPVAFGDFKAGYTIVDRQAVRLLRDPFTQKPYVLLYFTLRTGGQVVLAEAIKKLQCHT